MNIQNNQARKLIPLILSLLLLLTLLPTGWAEEMPDAEAQTADTVDAAAADTVSCCRYGQLFCPEHSRADGLGDQTASDAAGT